MPVATAVITICRLAGDREIAPVSSALRHSPRTASAIPPDCWLCVSVRCCAPLRFRFFVGSVPTCLFSMTFAPRTDDCDEEALLGHEQYLREKRLKRIGVGADIPAGGPSPRRTRVRMPPWNCRTTARILGGTPKRSRRSPQAGEFGRRVHVLW